MSKIPEKMQKEYADMNKEIDTIEHQIGKLNNERKLLQKQGKRAEMEAADKKIAELNETKVHLLSKKKKFDQKLKQFQ